jgi:hypothetical protein
LPWQAEAVDRRGKPGHGVSMDAGELQAMVRQV